ncbi:MAG: RagB/SusD family nutrient uptake outer membrane protein [Bacteroidaceae bacterium]|nr:RagB/SusD family nutrient uptake outer membrane protein [Bacteroidaceae bacterium]
MKKILYHIVCVAGLVGGLTSCADYLEVEPQTEILEENFWNEKADVDNIVAGCYQAMQGDAILKRMMIWGEFRSENVSPGSSNISNEDRNLEEILKENIKATNPYTFWGDFYNVINRCNLVIARAPQVAANDPSYSQSELKATIAEVTALRSLCYFYLIRAFRDVPYNNEVYVEDTQVMTLPAMPFNEVLDNLIADLEEIKGDAVKTYPKNKANYQTGRITQDAINAMLCEMYLWKQDYATCVHYADLVIESKKEREEERKQENAGMNVITEDFYNGFPLISNYTGTSTTPFGNAYESIFGEGDSKETIFELAFVKGNDNMPSNGAVNTFYGNLKVGMGYVRPSNLITNDVEASAFKIFYKNDCRAYEALDGEQIGKYVYSNIGTLVSSSGNAEGFLLMGMYPDGKNKSNWIIYRLTDIMLMKAEALVQMAAVTDGSNAEVNAANKELFTEAFILVNAINKRSLLQRPLKDTLVMSSYINSRSLMEELVLRERQCELMFEGKRWFDLVRRSQRDGNTTKLSSTATQKFSSTASLIRSKLEKMDAIYWPINRDELKVNPNLKQNPAYGSGDEEGNYEKT